jgi:hypothetical protein
MQGTAARKIALGVWLTGVAGLAAWAILSDSSQPTPTSPAPAKVVEAPTPEPVAATPTPPSVPVDKTPQIIEAKPVAFDTAVRFQTLPDGKVVGEPSSYTRQEVLSWRLKEFHDWMPAKQEQVVTNLMKDPSLDAEELAFFKNELFNKELSEVTRNNMANALIGQGKKDPTLHTVFLQMIDDPTESPIWRDYSLQFLATTLPYSSEPEVVVAKLKEVALRGHGRIQGTAVVQLAFHEAKGRLVLGEGFSKQTANALLDEEVDLTAKTSLLAVIGERKDVQNLEVARQFAAQDEVASLKRTAIAALGSIGDQSDLPLLESALQHKNRAVQMAAQGALKRLKARLDSANPA